jgi:uncharacterized protein (TIGR03067 family)
MSPSAICPDQATWRRLLEGSLPEPEQKDLTVHLDACAECRQVVDQLAAAGQSWSKIPAALAKAGDRDVRLAQVMAELKSEESKLGETLTQPGTADSQTGMTVLATGSSTPHERLGHYQIREVVGKGGMGVVLKAYDEKLQRIVAIKIMAPELAANATSRQRFIREARAAAAVSHDHIVTIHEVQEEHSPPYFVMQYVVGASLEERLEKKGPFGLKEILRIGMQAAYGLAAAHAQGLVHRDIKPANILLENGVERVKITDFGLARAVDDASVTQSGVISGTPMFMSPEQAAGETVDHRSDLFSLGSVLYILCTGRPPFRATGTYSVMKRVIEDRPRPIRDLNPEIPEWLEAIIAKLHAKKPEDRFQTAKEVAQLLEQHLAHLQQPSKVPMQAAVKQSEAPPQRTARTTSLLLPIFLMIVALLVPGFAEILGNWSLFLLAIPMAGGVMLAGLVILVARLLEIHRQDQKREPQQLTDFPTSAMIPSPPVPAHRTEPPSARVLWIWAPTCIVALILAGFVLIEGSPLAKAGAVVMVAGAGGGLAAFIYTLTNRNKDPLVARRSARRKRKWREFAAVLVFSSLILFLSLWLGPPLSRYFRNSAVVEVAPQDGLTSVIILQNDAAVTDWRDMQSPQTITLSPGRYHINPGLQPGYDYVTMSWELTTSGLFSSHTVRQSGSSCDFEVERGQRVTIRPIIRKEIPRPQLDSDDLRGWVQLFNGKDLTGWKTDPNQPGEWRVQNGVLVGGNGPGHLYTVRDDYRNFHLRAEVSISKGAEADIYFRSKMQTPSAPGPKNPSGYVMDLAEGQDAYAGPISFRNPQSGVWTTFGANFKVKPDEWFKLEIIADGDHLTTRINGERIVDIIEAFNPYPKGHIALQLWKTDTFIKFRKIEIGELPPNEPGWVQLFNGKDLTGWKPDSDEPGKKRWQVVDGILSGSGECGYLFSARDDYQNFRLRVTATALNSQDGNLYVRTVNSPSPGRPASAKQGQGYAVDIGGGSTGNIHVQSPKGIMSGSISNTGVKPRDWFSLEIIAEGSEIGTKVNGHTQTVNDDMYKKGHIALKVWDGQVQITKIEIKELPSSTTPVKSQPIINELRLLVTAEEQAVNRERARHQAGLSAPLELTAAEIKLLEARVRLAEAENNIAAKVARLTEIIGQHEKTLELIKKRVAAEADAPIEVDRAASALAEARMRLATELLAHPALAGPADVADQPSDQKKLQGRWRAVSMEQDGMKTDLANPNIPMPFDIVLTFTDDKCAMTIVDRKDGKAHDPPLPGVFHLNPQTNPKQISIIAPVQKPSDYGIYRLEGDTLTVCHFTAPPKDVVFPTEFTGKQGSGTTLMVFRREPAAEPRDEELLQGTWRAVSMESNGVSTDFTKLNPPSNFTWTFTDDKVSLNAVDLKTVFHLNTHVNPKQISMEQNRGIYHLEGDTLTVCFFDVKANSVAFPTEFSGKKGSEAKLLILRRERPVADKDGFVSLLNGKDLSGWFAPQPDRGAWQVDKLGHLIGKGDPRSYLFTQRDDYADFHLRAELQAGGGSAGGICIRCGLNRLALQLAPGYKVSLSADPPLGSLLKTMPEANGGEFVAIAAKTEFKASTWYVLEVIAQGNRITVKLNGDTVAAYTDEKQTYQRGRIALETYAPGTLLTFKKIEIKAPPAKPRPAPTDEIAPKYRSAIAKGLDFLAKEQKADGHWEAVGGQYTVSMTALAGMAMLMEGSTEADGKYAAAIRKAVDWLMGRSQPNGLLNNPKNDSDSNRYMFGHGYAMLFLASVYGREEDGDRKRKLGTILTKAVEFTGEAQVPGGGWGYVAAKEGKNFDESATTICQLQALRAARNAGIVVPRKLIDADYLRRCTSARGAIVYSIAIPDGGDRPALSAAALAAGEYDSDLARKWLGFCQQTLPLNKPDLDLGYWDYTHYYYAQAVYLLGEKGYEKLFPMSKPDEQLTWSKYRSHMFEFLLSKQSADGSWNVGQLGPLYSTACCLTILQLDNAVVPAYQR